MAPDRKNPQDTPPARLAEIRPANHGGAISTVGDNPQFTAHISEIPHLLFRSLSDKLGIGEERRITTAGMEYTIRALDPRHALTRFPGAIGVGQSHEHAIFVLWETVPRGLEDVFEPSPVLRLVAGPQTTGVWAHGRGERMQEMIFVAVEGNLARWRN